MKKISLVTMFLVCALVLSACGKRGQLEAPPGGNPNYPQSYPQ